MIYEGEVKILCNKIAVCDYEYVLSRIIRWVNNKDIILVSPIASYTLTLAFTDKTLRRKLNKFDYLLPDSQWVKRSIFFLYGKRLKERVYGPQLMKKVCGLSERNNYRIYLYGGTTDTLAKLVTVLSREFPKIKVVGSEPSKFRALSTHEELTLLSSIAKSRAQILFLGMGSPLQELFAVRISEKVSKALIVIPVGAAFDFVSRNKLQAPQLLQNLGFEWLYRFILEPKRLWKRYLIYGTYFAVLIMFQKLSQITKKGSSTS